ncbi:MAG: hypothetical protein ABI758_00020 [Candidatus Woesebacteria bacterium]
MSIKESLKTLSENPITRPVALVLIASILGACQPKEQIVTIQLGEEISNSCVENIMRENSDIVITQSRSRVGYLIAQVKKCTDHSIYINLEMETDNENIRVSQSMIIETPNGVKSADIGWDPLGVVAYVHITDRTGKTFTITMDSNITIPR